MFTLEVSLHWFVQDLVLIIPLPWPLPKHCDIIQCLHFPLVPLVSSLSAYKYIQSFPILKAKSKYWKVTVYEPVSYPFHQLHTVPRWGHSFFSPYSYFLSFILSFISLSKQVIHFYCREKSQLSEFQPWSHHPGRIILVGSYGFPSLPSFSSSSTNIPHVHSTFTPCNNFRCVVLSTWEHTACTRAHFFICKMVMIKTSPFP